MSLPAFSMRQLLEAGVHFGHQTHRWNPKMAPFIYGDRNGIHIIDLTKTVPLLQRALNEVRRVVAGGGRVLFVGTKRQASPIIADAAKRCGQYYVNHRWLGGMLTNWRTISKSIKRLKALDEQLADSTTGFTKKELLQLTRQRDKLERSLGGIREMGGLPDVLFVIDTNKEKIAIDEAQRLNIPIVAIVDTNCDPEPISYPVPGNDDATRAIKLYCDLMALTVLDGISEQLAASGADIGEAAEVVTETVVIETAAASAEEAAAEAAADETAAAEPVPAEPKRPRPPRRLRPWRRRRPRLRCPPRARKRLHRKPPRMRRPRSLPPRGPPQKSRPPGRRRPGKRRRRRLPPRLRPRRQKATRRPNRSSVGGRSRSSAPDEFALCFETRR